MREHLVPTETYLGFVAATKIDTTIFSLGNIEFDMELEVIEGPRGSQICSAV